MVDECVMHYHEYSPHLRYHHSSLSQPWDHGIAT